MANLIFRNYLHNKNTVLALANFMLEAHVGDTEEKKQIHLLLSIKNAELEKLNRKLDNFIEMRSDGEKTTAKVEMAMDYFPVIHMQSSKRVLNNLILLLNNLYYC